MKIRQANHNDIHQLVEIDQKAYGEYGADNRYFEEKFQSFPQGILVAEEDGKVTGFTVLEFLNEEKMPKDFTDFRPTETLKGRWIHIIAFTTSTNYGDLKADSELVKAAEKIGIDYGCISSCVPLTKNHPFQSNGVFDFWQANGYKVSGEISWVVSPDEKLECLFYKKDLN